MTLLSFRFVIQCSCSHLVRGGALVPVFVGYALLPRSLQFKRSLRPCQLQLVDINISTLWVRLLS